VTLFTGNSKLEIFWEKDGSKMIDRYNQWSLTLENLSMHDTGNYTSLVCSSIACIYFIFEVDVIGMLLSLQDN
jgi:hypothetical protein